MTPQSGFVHRTLCGLGISRLMRLTRQSAVVLAYHNVIDDEAPSVGDGGLHLRLSEFHRQLEWLRSTFRIVPLSEIAARLERGSSVRGLLGLSFDDAYRGAVRHALPWLSGQGLPATLFVATEAVTSPSPFWWDLPEAARSCESDPRELRLFRDRGDGSIIRSALEVTSDASLPDDYYPATWEMLRSVRGTALEFGAHSVSHRTMPVLHDEELRFEVRCSADTIANELGVQPRLFAYPYGAWDTRVRRAVAQAGYRSAFSLEGRRIHRRTHPFSLPRISVPATLGAEAFESWSSGYLDIRNALSSVVDWGAR